MSRSVTTETAVNPSMAPDVDLDGDAGAVGGPADAISTLVAGGRSRDPSAIRSSIGPPTSSSRAKPVSVSTWLVREHDPPVGTRDDQAFGRGLQQRARLEARGDRAAGAACFLGAFRRPRCPSAAFPSEGFPEGFGPVPHRPERLP